MSEAPRDPSVQQGLPIISIAVAAVALIAAVVGVGFGMRAIDESETNAASGAGAGTTEPAPVSLTEFAIPATSVGAGGSLHVTNDGSVAHNLVVEDTDVASADIDAGGSEHLALEGVEPGTYTMFCAIPGHREGGMEAELTVTEGGETEVAAAAAEGEGGDMAGMDHSGDEMDYEAMTEAMTASMSEYPAETEGVGNELLEPSEVQADGTKVFELTAEVVDWERAPGDVVQAWTYNGMVPGPSIHLDVGDRAIFRLTNGLDIATDLHLHGLNVDNEFDGVAPITQDPIEPGDSFDYEYDADEVAVAMFHPHFHSQIGMPNGMFGTIFVGQVPTHAGETIGDEVIPADLEVSQELPMVVNDSGVIGYSLNGKSFPATAPIVAQQGDWVLFHYFNEGSQSHPMHLHQFDQIVVAKDGYPLDQPYVADVINVAPGERYSVLVQLDKPGTWVWHCHILPHVEDDQGMFGMVTAVVVE
jgi:FtsP/CotA-like multicopper oxidase with cupredoxin domain